MERNIAKSEFLATITVSVGPHTQELHSAHQRVESVEAWTNGVRAGFEAAKPMWARLDMSMQDLVIDRSYVVKRAVLSERFAIAKRLRDDAKTFVAIKEQYEEKAGHGDLAAAYKLVSDRLSEIAEEIEKRECFDPTEEIKIRERDRINDIVRRHAEVAYVSTDNYARGWVECGFSILKAIKNE